MPSKSAAGVAVRICDRRLYPGRPRIPRTLFLFEAANTSVDRRSHTDAEGKSIIDENWTSGATTATSFRSRWQFARGVPTSGTVEGKVLHSAAKPDFYRIYKFEQAADVVRSRATGVDRVSKFSFKVSGPKLAPLFDGSQQLISITSVPFYSRTIYLPAI